jgi:hypothetical protein
MYSSLAHEFLKTSSTNMYNKKNKQTQWSESAIELYPPSDRRLSAK